MAGHNQRDVSRWNKNFNISFSQNVCGYSNSISLELRHDSGLKIQQKIQIRKKK